MKNYIKKSTENDLDYLNNIVYSDAYQTGFCQADFGKGQSFVIQRLAGDLHERTLLVCESIGPIMATLEGISNHVGNKVANLDRQSKRLWITKDKNCWEGRWVDYCIAPDDNQRYQGQRYDLMIFLNAEDLNPQSMCFLQTWNTCIAKLRNPTPRNLIFYNESILEERMKTKTSWLVKYFAPWLQSNHPNPAELGEIRHFVFDRDLGEEVEVPSADPVKVKIGDGEHEVLPQSRTFFASISNEYTQPSA